MTDTPEALPTFTFNIHPIASGFVVEARGDLDLVSVPGLNTEIEDLISDLKSTEDDQKLIIDLRQIDFIDSAGLALLVRVSRDIADTSHPLKVVVESQSQPERILKIGQFYRILDLIYEVDEA